LKKAAILGGVVVIFGVAAGQFYGGVAVEAVIDSGLSERVKTATQEYLGQNPLRRLDFWLDKEGLRNYLAEKIPEVGAEVEFGREGWWAPSLVVECAAREPLLVWRAGGEKYFVDKFGVVFKENYYPIEPGITVVDNNNLAVGGKMPQKILAFLGQLVSDAGEMGLGLSEVSIPAGRAREVDVRVEREGKGLLFKLSVERSAAQQVEDMERVMRHLEGAGVKIEGLEYVDIRVEGRAFYK
jgi:hypothetical protein